MSSHDLDLPLLPSAEQIRRREFATIRRGYDTDQVRDYLLQVAAQVEALEQELREARLEREAMVGDRAAAEALGLTPTEAAPSADPYDLLAQRFAGIIGSADREAEKVLGEATAEASRVLEEARAEADRIRVDAQARAEEARQQGSEVLQRAKVEADAILATLLSRRATLVTQLDEMRSKLLSVARTLELSLDDEDRDRVGAEPASSGTRDTGDEVDPRYEDMWASRKPIGIPDLEPTRPDRDEEPRSL